MKASLPAIMLMMFATVTRAFRFLRPTQRRGFFLCSSSTSSSSSSSTADNVHSSVIPEKSNICIVGGGFGGVYSAVKLTQLLKDNPTVTVTLIDPKDKFVFLPLLYELAVGAATVQEVAPLYAELLKGSRVQFCQGTVHDINLQANELRVTPTSSHSLSPSSSLASSSSVIKYDQLLMAVGACPRLDLVPGAKEFSIPFYRVEDAYDLKLRLRALKDANERIIRVVVLGGGYSGVEVATSVAKYLGKDRAVVTIVQKNERIIPTSPDNNRNAAERVLSDLGVSINCNTIATRVTEKGVSVKDTVQGTEFDLEADLVLFTSGSEPSPLVKKIELPKDRYGRILVDRTLQSQGRVNVFALGDCCGIDGEQVPTTAQAAMGQADIAAKNLAYRAINYSKGKDVLELASRPGALEKFRYVSLGEVLTLGGADGAITGFGGLVRLQGPVAAIGRRLAYAFRMPTRTQQITAAVNVGLSQAAAVKDKATSRLFGQK